MAGPAPEKPSGGGDLFPDVAKAMLGMSADATEETELSVEEEERLQVEFEANYEEAVRVFEVRFADLPPIIKLRELWKERQISEEDPIWIIVEVMSLHDARSQLVLAQLMRIIKASDDLNRFMVQRVERASERLTALNKEAAAVQAKVIAAKASADTLIEQLTTYGRLQPLLLKEMVETRTLMDVSRLRAKLELAGIGAVCVLAGLLLGKLFFR